MRIALASTPVKNRDVSYNLSAIVQTIETYCDRAELIVFGESALQGFECLTWDYRTDCLMAAAQNAPEIRRICEAARKNHIAVSFGYIEKVEESLYSSQIVIDATGTIIHNFHRISVGWKEYWYTDEHYREGNRFETFSYMGKSFAIGLCGDLWTEGRPEEMSALNPDIVLWPVWCDFKAKEWNSRIKYEYADQAKLCGDSVLLVNPFCVDEDSTDAASGGAAHFKDGHIMQEVPAGSSGILIVEI